MDILYIYIVIYLSFLRRILAFDENNGKFSTFQPRVLTQYNFGLTQDDYESSYDCRHSAAI